MKKIKRQLRQFFAVSLNTEQISYIGREADPGFKLEAVTGFGAHIVIPRQVAADAIVDYFDSKDRLVHLCGVLFQLDGRGGSGGIIDLRGVRPLQIALEEQGFKYEQRLGRFVQTQSPRKTNDWGYLKNNEEYRLTFMSLDVVGSSGFVETNLKIDIENTFRNLQSWVRFFIESENGRLWYWHGDGGLAAFLEEEGVSLALRSALKILSRLPVFNMIHNELRYEDELRLRIGVHYGTAHYLSDTARIQSDDIQETIRIEQRFGLPNSITVSESAIQLASAELQKFFSLSARAETMALYRNLTL